MFIVTKQEMVSEA